MEKTTFTLERIMTISTTIWFTVAGLIIVLGYFGIKVLLGDELKMFSNSLYALTVATVIILGGFMLFKKKYQKEKVIIEVINKQDIIIYFDDQIKVSSPISDLIKINTIHRVNTKADVQAEILFKEGKVDLYNTGNHANKESFDDFIIFLEKEFDFTYRKAPFSLKYSKNYVEYINPLYHE